MMGFILGYSVAKSSSRARARRDERPDGYGAFEFMVLMGALFIGVMWPIHLGIVLRGWGLHLALAISIATALGIIGLATGWGYVVIGFIYSGIWLGVLIDRGVRSEQLAAADRDDDGGEV